MFSAFDALTRLKIVLGLNTYSVSIDRDETEHNLPAGGCSSVYSISHS